MMMCGLVMMVDRLMMVVGSLLVVMRGLLMMVDSLMMVVNRLSVMFPTGLTRLLLREGRATECYRTRGKSAGNSKSSHSLLEHRYLHRKWN